MPDRFVEAWCSLNVHRAVPSLLLPVVLAAAIPLIAACQRGPVAARPRVVRHARPRRVAPWSTEQLAALRAAPADANRWGLLGMALEANGAHARRRGTATRRRRRCESAHGRWWYHLARLRRARRRRRRRRWRRSTRPSRCSPDYVPARWRRGLLLLDRGDLAGAEAAFRVAVESGARTTRRAPPAWRACRLPAAARLRPPRRSTRCWNVRRPTATPTRCSATAYRAPGRRAEAAEAAAAGVSVASRSGIDPWSDEVGAYRRGFAAMLKEATALSDGRPLSPRRSRCSSGCAPSVPTTASCARTWAASTPPPAARATPRALLEAVLQARPDDFDATMHLATAHLFAGDLRRGRARRAARARAAAGDADADAAARRRGLAARSGSTTPSAGWPRPPRPNPTRCQGARRGWARSAQERGRPAEALAAFREALARDPLLADALVGGACGGARRPARSTTRRVGWRARRAGARAPAARRASSSGWRPKDARDAPATRSRAALAAAVLAAAWRRLRSGAGAATSRAGTAPARRRRAVVRGRRRGARASRSRTDPATPGATYRLPEIMGGGAALFDMDGDGDLDALLVQSGSLERRRRRPAPPAVPQRRTRPLRRRHRGQRRRRARATAWASPPATTTTTATSTSTSRTSAPTCCCRTTAAAASPTSPRRRAWPAAGWSTSAAFVDVDADGDLDLFVTRYLDWAPGARAPVLQPHRRGRLLQPEELRRADAPTCSSATPATARSPTRRPAPGSPPRAATAWAWSPTTSNGDGRLDVFVANDGTPNHLWINHGRRPVRGIGAGAGASPSIRTARPRPAWACTPPTSTTTATTTCSS